MPLSCAVSTRTACSTVLRGYLDQHGYASITHAAKAAAQADPGFDEDAFRAKFEDALGDGRLRAVIVLDEAPADLVELVGYLQDVTSDRLALDLVVVTAFEVAGQRILVPQLVEPDRTQVTAELAGTGKPSTGSEIVPGSEEFEGLSKAHRPISSRYFAGCWSGPSSWSETVWLGCSPRSEKDDGS